MVGIRPLAIRSLGAVVLALLLLLLPSHLARGERAPAASNPFSFVTVTVTYRASSYSVAYTQKFPRTATYGLVEADARRHLAPPASWKLAWEDPILTNGNDFVVTSPTRPLGRFFTTVGSVDFEFVFPSKLHTIATYCGRHKSAYICRWGGLFPP